jgi:hypothetical protein
MKQKSARYHFGSKSNGKGCENERVVNVQQNPSNEGAGIQYPADIANHPSKAGIR